MTKLLEQAVAKASNLSEEKQNVVAEIVLNKIELEQAGTSSPHSVMDIGPVSLGKIIRLPNPDDDLLGEMVPASPDFSGHVIKSVQ